MATTKRRTKRPRQDSARPRQGLSNVGEASTTPPGWPTGEQIAEVLDLDATALRALADVSADDILAILQQMPPRSRQFVVHFIGMHAAGSVNRGMAAQLLAQLRRQDDLGRGALLRGIVMPLVAMLDTDELSAEEWALLYEDSDASSLRILADHEEFAGHLDSTLGNLPTSLLQAAFVAAIGTNVACAAVALAFLARDDERSRDAHAALLKEFPAMPTIPTKPLAALGPVPLLVSAGLLPPEATPNPEQVVDLLEIAAADHIPGAIGDLAETLPADQSAAAETLLDGWDATARKLIDAAGAMHDGALPSSEDLDHVLSFVDAVDAVLGAAADLSDAEDLEMSRDGLARAVDILRLSKSSNEDEPWLAELAGLTAPAALEDAASLVRNLARGVPDPGERAGLHGLHTLIGLTAARRVGQPVDYDAVASAQADAREHLPPEASQLVFAAAVGDLTLADSGDSVGGISSPRAGLPLAQASPDSSSSEFVTDGVTAPAEHARAEKAPKPVKAVPAGVEAPPPDSTSTGAVAEPGQSVVDEDELADLDGLLSNGAAARLAMATGARRATAAKSMPSHLDPELSDETAISQDESMDGRPEATAPDLDADEVQATLLRAGRFGLAADLHQARGAPAAQVSARRLAAYAAELRQATGPLAAAFAREASTMTREALADDHCGQLLAWAAAVRIAVLAPSAGAAGLIAEFTPSVSDYPRLAEVGQAFADASRSGLLVLPEAASAVGALSDFEAKAAEFARIAAETVSLARQRTIKYPPANLVYQVWMGANGALGRMLGMIAENNADNLAATRQEVVELRGRAAKSIKEIHSSHRRNPHVRIVGGAYTTLVSRWDDAVELASRWAQVAELAADQASSMHRGRWQAGPLATLRARVRDLRGGALDDLAIAAQAPDGAGEGAARLVAEAFAVCDGRPPTGDDVEPTFAAHGELLATALALSPATLTPDGGLSEADVPMLLAAAGVIPAWADVYDRRAEAGDHDLTAVLILALQRSEPSAAASLQLRRDADVAETGESVGEEVSSIESLVDARRLAGALDDDVWSSLSARVAALDDPARRDFGRMRCELAEIAATLDAALAAKTGQTIARIEARAADSPIVADAAEELVALSRSGHIASAEEYLEQALTGGPLPTFGASIGHLQRFYPAVPELAAAHPDVLVQLSATLHGDPPTALTARLGEIVGVDLTMLPQPRRDLGGRALRGWRSLRGRPGKDAQVDVTTALRAVLGQAGFEFGELKLHPPARGHVGRQWITIGGVTGTGNALHPALGSAMSQDGATLRILLVHQAASPATVVEWMSSEPADHSVIVLWLAGPLSIAGRRAIANAARGRPRPPLLLLDDAALAYLTCQLEPRRTTFAEITLPFTAINPYRDSPGDAPPEMFYGRTEEMADVLDLAGPSILYGGRQLGKSALLRAAERRFREDGPDRAVVLTSIFTVGADGRPDQLWSALWPKLAAEGIVGSARPAEGDLAAAAHDGILAWLAVQPARALLILLDEADAFLDADAADNLFTNVDWCRRIREESGRRAKFVFAGLHRTARFESLPNQPLSHFGRPVSVGPLRPQHAYDLLTGPLAALGFQFADRTAIPARILALTNNMPAVLQLFGKALVAHLTSRPVGSDEPPTIVTDADVDAVLANADLLDAFRDKFVLTLNLDHRYLVIAYAVAQATFEHGIDTSLSIAELSSICRQAWPQGFASCGADDFRGLVTECVDLGVLAADASRYRMRTPTVLRLLGTEEEVLETLYSAPERLSVPSISDAGSYRRRLPGTLARSPLTETQLGRIFGERAGTFVIGGSTALGLDRVSIALEQAHEEGVGRFGQVVRAPTLTPDGLRRTIEMLTAAHALVIADVRNVSIATLRELLWTSSDAAGVAELSGVAATVVLIAGPANAAGWVDSAELIELSRLDRAGLRLWCDEDGLPFRDDVTRAELLVATGGWHKLVARVAERSTEGPVASAAKTLAELASWLSGAGAREFTAAAGVGQSGGVLARVFAAAAPLTTDFGADVEYLSELLELDEITELATEATAAGFASVGAVVEALSVLGCLPAGPDGSLQAEPLLAAAVATATTP